MTDYHDRIVLDPAIRGGKPIIRGTRITVGDILDYLAGGCRRLKLWPTSRIFTTWIFALL